MAAIRVNNEWLHEILACPFCHEPLALVDNAKSVQCCNRHNFDIAKQGYISLLTSNATNKKWDTADMVERRVRFHENDNYLELKNRLRELLSAYHAEQIAKEGSDNPLRLLDIGSGPGYYALLAAELGYQTVASDLSRKALQHAVKLHPNIEGVACDVWSRLPFADNSFDVILSVFAPKNPEEFSRVLKPSGILVVATPNKDHYAQMRAVFPVLKVGRTDKTKEDELRERLEPAFHLVSSEQVRGTTVLDRQYIEDLIMMGPNAYHTNLEELRSLLIQLEKPLIDEASLTLHVYSLN